MICTAFLICLIHTTFLQACPDPQTTNVQIHNHDGPIYIHPQHDLITTNQSPLLHNSQTPCTNSQTPCQNPQTPCQNPQTPCQNSQTPSYNSQTPYYSSQTPCQNPTECTCVTKQQSNCIPINCVPQSQCKSNTYYKYPDSIYSNGDALRPQVIGEVVLTYGTQNMCPNPNNCQNGYLYGYY